MNYNNCFFEADGSSFYLTTEDRREDHGKKRYEGVEIKPVHLDGEEIIITSGCVTSFDLYNPGRELSGNDTINTTGLNGFDYIAPGFYTLDQIAAAYDAAYPEL